MKKITTLLLASTCSFTFFNTFGMLLKRTLYPKKYVRTVQTQKNNRSGRIKELLSINRFEPSEGQENYQSYEENNLLTGLYFRNNTIIGLLEEDMNDIKQKIKTLKEQQNCAISNIDYYDTGEVKALERELHKKFNIDKDPQ